MKRAYRFAKDASMRGAVLAEVRTADHTASIVHCPEYGVFFLLTSLNLATLQAVVPWIEKVLYKGDPAILAGRQSAKITFFATKSEKIHSWPIKELSPPQEGTSRSLGGGKVENGAWFVRGRAPMGLITIDGQNILAVS